MRKAKPKIPKNKFQPNDIIFTKEIASRKKIYYTVAEVWFDTDEYYLTRHDSGSTTTYSFSNVHETCELKPNDFENFYDEVVHKE